MQRIVHLNSHHNIYVDFYMEYSFLASASADDSDSDRVDSGIKLFFSRSRTLTRIHISVGVALNRSTHSFAYQFVAASQQIDCLRSTGQSIAAIIDDQSQDGCFLVLAAYYY
eukprot:scaffold9156_cov92-Skeletonema_dohrnii-CCMP3373.AAC.1